MECSFLGILTTGKKRIKNILYSHLWKCRVNQSYSGLLLKNLSESLVCKCILDFPEQEIELSFLNSFGPRAWFMEMLMLSHSLQPPNPSITSETMMMGEESVLQFIPSGQVLWVNHLDAWVISLWVTISETLPWQIRTDVVTLEEMPPPFTRC